MTTYNTYAEAKIANPESQIYTLYGKFAANSSSELGQVLQPCNPADHLMTVEKFLADGYKAVAGDLYQIGNGRVEELKEVGEHSFNRPTTNDSNVFIIRAAALEQTETPEEKESFDVMAQDNEAAEAKAVAEFEEIMPKRGEWWMCENKHSEIANKMALYFNGNIWSNCEKMSLGAYSPLLITPMFKLDVVNVEQPKPKRTKTEYVKVEVGAPWEYFKLMHELGDLYVLCTDDSYEGFDGCITNLTNAVEDVIAGSIDGIYRKVETEITECEEFIEFVESIAEDITQDEWSFACIATAMFESGRVKLVDGE